MAGTDYLLSGIDLGICALQLLMLLDHFLNFVFSTLETSAS